MLLTSSQISMTISSFIVFIFTSLLFLSGYVLQQQTVHSLQAAINPPKPTPTVKPTPSASAAADPRKALRFGDPFPDTRAQHPYQEYISADDGARGRPRFAYVQLVKEHMHVCNAVMLFAELQRAKNKAARVLLYPSAWDFKTEREDEAESVQRAETSKRLLQMAAERYKVVIQPVGPLPESADPFSPISYPLSLLFSLAKFDRLLSLSASGILLEPESLDSFFDYPLEIPMTSFPAHVDGSSPSVFLIRPSKSEYDRLKHLPPSSQPTSSSLPTPEDPITDSSSSPIILQTSTLLNPSSAHQPRDLNATTLLASTAYIHISDPNLPGPEYDIPRGSFLAARPQEGQARKVWEFAYERFREDRMRVCGLDLEPWKDEE